MITQEQHETLQEYGYQIAAAESTANKANTDLFRFWWKVGTELNKPQYHTGDRKGSISREDMVDICKDLGLSSTVNGHGVSGASTISKARMFAREFPQESELPKAIAKYKIWSAYGDKARMSKYVGAGQGNTGKRRKSSGAGEIKRELRAPHNIKAIWLKAIKEYMASNPDCTWDEAREIFFLAMAEMDYLSYMRIVRNSHPMFSGVG